MQPALEKAYGGKIPGRLLLKKDSHLDIAGVRQGPRAASMKF